MAWDDATDGPRVRTRPRPLQRGFLEVAGALPSHLPGQGFRHSHRWPPGAPPRRPAAPSPSDTTKPAWPPPATSRPIRRGKPTTAPPAPRSIARSLAWCAAVTAAAELVCADGNASAPTSTSSLPRSTSPAWPHSDLRHAPAWPSRSEPGGEAGSARSRWPVSRRQVRSWRADHAFPASRPSRTRCRTR